MLCARRISGTGITRARVLLAESSSRSIVGTCLARPTTAKASHSSLHLEGPLAVSSVTRQDGTRRKITSSAATSSLESDVLAGITPLKPYTTASNPGSARQSQESHELEIIPGPVGSGVHDLPSRLRQQTELDSEAREERRSPAAVFGSKRVGLEIVPEKMEEGVLRELAGECVTNPPRV